MNVVIIVSSKLKFSMTFLSDVILLSQNENNDKNRHFLVKRHLCYIMINFENMMKEKFDNPVENIITFIKT